MQKKKTNVAKLHGMVEWLGCIASVPAVIKNKAEHYSPELLIWISADGTALEFELGERRRLLQQACGSLRSTIKKAKSGKARSPTRLRVASPELAAAIRSGFPDLDVVCAPTPELDDMLAGLQDHFGARSEDVDAQTYLTPGIEPSAMSSLFDAAAELFRAKPWKKIPGDDSLVSITIDKLGIRDAAVSVIGQMGEVRGFIIFSSFDDYEDFLDATTLIETDAAPSVPPHFALTFERGADLPAGLRKEVASHGWTVAGPKAYPEIYAVEGAMTARPPTAKELVVAEAVAVALAAAMGNKRALRKALIDGEPVSISMSASTHAGVVDVILGIPYVPPANIEKFDGLLGELAAVSDEDIELHPDAREKVEDALLRRFVASPEACGFMKGHHCQLFMQLGADYIGETIATLQASDLRELLFELFPRKAAIPASVAGEIVEELHAFYNFLKREFKLVQADACIKVLAGNGSRLLQAALSDRSKFGLAKSMLTAGADAGFDMQSQEGIQSWMTSLEGKPLPSSISLPGFPPQNVAPATSGKRKPVKKAPKRR